MSDRENTHGMSVEPQDDEAEYKRVVAKVRALVDENRRLRKRLEEIETLSRYYDSQYMIVPLESNNE